MTTYQVIAWCSVPHRTTFDVEAGSVEEALEKAREKAKDTYGEPCDGASHDWDEFDIVSEGDADEHIRHLEPARLVENAASELLVELQSGIEHAQTVTDSWEHGDLASAVRAMAKWLVRARETLRHATRGETCIDIQEVVKAARAKFGAVMKVIRREQSEYFVACKRDNAPLAERPYMTITACCGKDAKGVAFYWGHYDLTIEEVYASIVEGESKAG